MTQTIYKYEVLVGVPTVHEMPVDAVVELVLAPTPDTVVMWVRLDTSPLARIQRREFKVSGTGQTVDPSWTYAGSCAAPLGLMWHLWERAER